MLVDCLRRTVDPRFSLASWLHPEQTSVPATEGAEGTEVNLRAGMGFRSARSLWSCRAKWPLTGPGGDILAAVTSLRSAADPGPLMFFLQASHKVTGIREKLPQAKTSAQPEKPANGSPVCLH